MTLVPPKLAMVGKRLGLEDAQRGAYPTAPQLREQCLLVDDPCSRRIDEECSIANQLEFGCA
jgi:hypothetical protein